MDPKRCIIDQNDPRISGMLRGSNARERFLVLAAATILASGGVLDQVLNGDGTPMEIHERVAGRPFSHWLGKDARDVHRECGCPEKFAQVKAAFEARGIKLEGAGELFAEIAAKNAAALAEAEAAKKVEDVLKGEGKGEGEEKAPEAPAALPKFAGIPADQLAGKSDAELLAINGMSKTAIKKLRAWEKENAAAAVSKPAAGEGEGEGEGEEEDNVHELGLGGHAGGDESIGADEQGDVDGLDPSQR